MEQGKDGHFDMYLFNLAQVVTEQSNKKKQRASNLEKEVKLSLSAGDMISIQKTRKPDKGHMPVPPAA